MLLLFLSALSVGFSGSMMPGPLLTYTIRQSLAKGSRVGLAVTAGHALLELALVILIFLGLGGILQSGAAQIAIGVIGGAMLATMGVGMVRGAVRNTVKIRLEAGKVQADSLFLSGVLISAANPYFLLWWAAVGLGFILQAYSAFGLAGVALYYIGHISADFIWYGSISAIVGLTRKFIREKPYRVIIAALGCVLVFFGGKFLLTAAGQVVRLFN